MLNIELLSTTIWTMGLIFIILSLIQIIFVFRRIRLIKRKKIYILFIFCIILILLTIACRWIGIILLRDMSEEITNLYKIIFTFSFLVVASSLLLWVFKSILNKIMSQHGKLKNYRIYIENEGNKK